MWWLTWAPILAVKFRHDIVLLILTKNLVLALSFFNFIWSSDDLVLMNVLSDLFLRAIYFLISLFH